jgi:hypothetical protein
VELLGARVYGSRSREGLYHDGADIDVVVSYSGSLREDAFFNEAGNPLRFSKSGNPEIEKPMQHIMWIWEGQSS